MIIVSPQKQKFLDGFVEVSAVLQCPSKSDFLLWYRLPESYAPNPYNEANALTIAVTMFAMEQGVDVCIRGSVCSSLLANLEEYQVIWSTWKPDRYKIVKILADECDFPLESPIERPSVACFSGGVDACYTVYRHAKGIVGRRTRSIAIGLLIHGLDLPLEAKSAFRQIREGATEALSSIGIKTVSMETNWRSLNLNWEDSHATALASCLHLIGNKNSYGLIGSTEPYSNLIPWGSNPLTDPLLSSQAFSVEHDGAGAHRTNKVSLIAQWPEAMRNLRVCWEGPSTGKNCGKCEKCIRTNLNFRAAGLPLPISFEHDISLDQIQRVPIRNETQRSEFASILDYAETSGLANEKWVEILRRRMAESHRNPHGFSFLQRLRMRAGMRTRLRNLLPNKLQST